MAVQPWMPKRQAPQAQVPSQGSLGSPYGGGQGSYVPSGAVGSTPTFQEKARQTLQQQERGARATDAFESAKRASEAGIGYNTSYTDPFTGVTYNYQGSGGGAGGGGSRSAGATAADNATDASAPVNWEEAFRRINPAIAPGPPPREEAPARITGPSQADRRAAESAAFARAKDRIGQTGAGAMTALTRAMSRRGLGGSGIEGGQIGNLVSGLRGQLGDVVRSQTLEGLARDQAVEDRNYAGDISQRGADMGFATGQRGQDIQAAGQRASSIPALMSLFRQYQQGTPPVASY
jgi:hypothetical protein